MGIEDKKFKLEKLRDEMSIIQDEVMELWKRECQKQTEITKLLNEIDNEDDEDTI